MLKIVDNKVDNLFEDGNKKFVLKLATHQNNRPQRHHLELI